MIICKNGHKNQAGGCCCPLCGNTCGFHPEYPGRDESLPLVKGGLLRSEALTTTTLTQLAATSPAWGKRLKKVKAI